MKAQIFNYTTWIESTEPSALRVLLEEYLVKSGFTILNYMEHHFQPQGFTAIWLLGESHLAVHTFPEEAKTYVELSSCNEEMYEVFKQLMA